MCGCALEEARTLGVPDEVMSAVLDQWEITNSEFGGDSDFTAIVQMIETPRRRHRRGRNHERRHPRGLCRPLRRARAHALGELHFRRSARRDDFDLLLRLGDQRPARHLRVRYRLRRGGREGTRAQDHSSGRRGAQGARRAARQSAARDRHPYALGSCRQLRPVPQCALSHPGHRDGLRHRPLHVPPDAAHAVQRARRARRW